MDKSEIKYFPTEYVPFKSDKYAKRSYYNKEYCEESNSSIDSLNEEIKQFLKKKEKQKQIKLDDKEKL